MNRPGIFAAALAATLVASAFGQTNVTLKMQVSGKARIAIAHVPPSPDKPPVVFFIHGANGSGGAFQNETKANTTADREKFIAVFPSASSDGNTGTWDDMSGTGNYPFFFAILDSLDARYKIDRNRVYMTGFSQGGFISFAAACFYSDKFAAVAPVSGHVGGTTCAIKRPVPVFMTWGAAEGNSFLKDRDQWTKLNKCTETSTQIKPYPASNPNSKAVRVIYPNCDQGTSVILDSIIGQQHQWPSASNLNQADEVWAFFKQYSLSGSTALHPQAQASGHAPIAVSYAQGSVRLRGIAEGARLRVTDSRGRVVASEASFREQFEFAGKSGGIYLVTVSGNGSSFSRKIAVP